MWLWHRPAATAPIRPLAWETSYAAGAAPKRHKDQKKKKKEEEEEEDGRGDSVSPIGIALAPRKMLALSRRSITTY